MNSGKKIAIGGSITDTTHASTRYAPSASSPHSQSGAPSTASSAFSAVSPRESSRESSSDG